MAGTITLVRHKASNWFKMTAASITSLCSLLLVASTTAFVPAPPLRTQQISSSGRGDESHLITLNATKKKKTAKKKSSGGGFGSSSATAIKPKQQKRTPSNDDTIQYPQLEDQVRQTLIPSPSLDSTTNEDSAAVLAEEMYDRLEDIYGFDKFNFGGVGAIYNSIDVAVTNNDGDGSEEQESVVTKQEVEGSLFDDILSGGSSSSSSIGGLDPLEDLFGKSPSPASTPSASTDTAATNEEAGGAPFDLNSIPPFEKFRVLHTDPMVLAIDDFFTYEECDKYVQMSIDAENQQTQTNVNNNNNNNAASSLSESKLPMLLGQSQTIGKDSRSKAQRTSTTWFHYYSGVPELMAKASRLLGLTNIRRFEEPQTVRYRRNEKFTWHLDALSPEEVKDVKSGAGQRVATLLVYLTDVPIGSGGATMFRDLGNNGEPLKVRPKKGSALLFFPSAGGIPGAPFDIRTLHCGEAVAEDAENEKWIAQLWLREREYVPTAPVGNCHEDASGEIGRYCESHAELS